MCFRWFPVADFAKVGVCSISLILGFLGAAGGAEKPVRGPFNLETRPISTDKSVRYDYDIVYVRAARAGNDKHKRFYTDFSQPVTMEPGADLMLLHPDGSEELLVACGKGSITDPYVAFDGQWVYYVQIYNLEKRDQWSPSAEGADIFKIHVPTRRIVRLTNQVFTPNTGAAEWTKDFRGSQGDNKKTHLGYGVYNMGPCPLPGGRLAFTSNRDGVRPAKGYPAMCLQLFVMDDRDESISALEPSPINLTKIGHMNLAGALHPVILADGRIIFSTLESQGVRSDISWGVWSIHPDGTNWEPLVSAFDPGGASNGFHFQTQLADRSIIVEGYYNQNNSGFGSLAHLPAKQPYPAFGPAWMDSPRNKPWHFGHGENGRPNFYKMPFLPAGSEAFTTFAHIHDAPADFSVPGDRNSARVGKVTHPSGVPDNHLLLVYSPGPTNHQYTFLPQLDGGIYLAKDGKPVDEPGQMLLIKNDPNYNECWPRALVPYKRIYGIDEPARLAELANDGSLSPELPAGTPFGLVGTSSLYKRESYPNGQVPDGKVTAAFKGGNDPWRGLDAFTSHGNGMPLNWHNQGGDVGLYSNDEIHAIRILAMEPTTDRNRGDRAGRRFESHANERLRILGEIPVRKFNGDQQPNDPDGNPDTSFLAKVPADTSFTFQTLDREGLVLNMAQTWHQVRPGEIRNNCGGCHAHSQEPTDFSKTVAAKSDYKVWDLTDKAPLLADKPRDQSRRKWNSADDTGLRYVAESVVNVEYFRDIQPLFAKSCVACHSEKSGKAAGNLVLDGDLELLPVEHHSPLPGTYVRLAMDERGKFGHKPPSYDSWGYPNASRYIRKFQSRRSLLTWKVFGRRLDGFQNEDHPSEPQPGAGYLVHNGKRVNERREWYDLDYTGSPMPPPDAVAGTFKDANVAGGQTVKVESLTDEDRRTIARWIDLGCPIDLDRNPEKPQERGYGFMCDDNRPIVALALPRAGLNQPLDKILLGLDDYYSGLDHSSLAVTADFEIDGTPAGENLASHFKPSSRGVWQWTLTRRLDSLARGTIIVSVRDRQGNENRITRTFSVAK